VEALAAHLDADGCASAEHTLTTLRTGGDGEAVWFVHPAGGQVTGYEAVAARLDGPSYGFVADARDADAGRLENIETIATRYVDELVKAMPDGPLTVCGWSSGGCIAFEMALQLEARGRAFRHLVLLDCPAPLVHDAIAPEAMTLGFLEDIGIAVAHERLEPGAFHAGDDAGRLAAALHAADRVDATDQAAALLPFYRVFDHVVAAVRAYTPRQRLMGTPVTLLRAAEGQVTEYASHPMSAEPDWGWREFIAATLRCHSLPATHQTLVQAPCAARVAVWLKLHDEPVSNQNERAVTLHE
jgi:thioesterase domain-containing protein